MRYSYASFKSITLMLQTIRSTSTIEQDNETAVQIIHATKGHIRLRLPQLKNDSVFVEQLTTLIRSLDFVETAHVNPAALSLTINFDSTGCSEATLLNSVAFAIRRAASPLPGCHTTRALAQRLRITSQALTCHRMRIDFAQWSQGRDPEGLSWSYDEASKTFHTNGFSVNSAVQESAQEPSKGERVLQSIKQSVGVRTGAEVGRMAGQTVGMMVLGTVGMAVGAEVGTWVGEIVGSELLS